MKPYIHFIFSVIIVFHLFQGKECYGQYSTEKINQIVSVLEKIHIAPLGINDTLSNRVYKKFIESLDPGEFIFLTKDIKLFEIYKDSIDDQINSKKYPFLNLVGNIYIKRLYQIDSLVSILLEKDLSFSKLDTVTFNSTSKTNYKSSLKSLSKKWENWMKYKVLQNLYSTYPTLTISNKDSLAICLKHSVKKIKEETKCIIDPYSIENKERIEYSILCEFLDAIALSYDPHSTFFTDEAKTSFDNSLSKESMGFGLFLEEDEGVIKVESMIPGSPAWKSSQINKGDVITKIIYHDSLEINLSCISAFDIEGILLSNSITDIKITLIKKSGKPIEIPLSKEVIETDENVMTALVLEGEKRVGYLPIPSFYSNSESEMVKGCANDVAKEILKMKKDSIDGLIIDLRFNGGGSLAEAIDFAGIFIDVGPIGSVSSSKGKPKLMKDMNRGTAYRGPLVILINGASASASEVLAGALQLHNRAVIVGSSSYGKSTGQIIVPIDTNYWNNNAKQPEEFVKVTTIKLHNVKNGSHQQVGVLPDLILPDIWESFIPSESDENYALENDSIIKNVYLKPYPQLPISTLQTNSKERIKMNTVFNYIVSANDSITQSKDEEIKLPLTVYHYWKYASSKNKNYDFLEKSILNNNSSFTPKHLSYNKEIQQLNPRFDEKNKRLFKTLKEDITLHETYNILIDLISLTE